MRERASDPALYRRRLRSELRKAREALGMSHREVALAMDWSVSKLIRIEAGAVTITTNDLRVLLGHYGVTDQDRIDELVEVARRAREKSPWWIEFRDIASPETLAVCGYESSAKVIRNFQPLLVPGLLQTEEYASELVQHMRGPKDRRRLDGLVKLRLQRQELLLNSPDEPSLHFMMDEAVVRRIVGGRAAMRRQLQHIKEMGRQANITLSIVPFDHGWYRGLRVPYVHYEFDDPEDEAILYLEDPDGGATVIGEERRSILPVDEDEGAPTPEVYLEMFWELEQVATSDIADAIVDDALRRLTAAPTQVDLSGDRVATPVPKISGMVIPEPTPAIDADES